jgi:hypothetical protein
MNELAITTSMTFDRAAKQLLNGAAICWFALAALGMWIFVFYVIGYYGPMLIQGGVEALSESHLPNGFVAGDSMGNAAVVAHLVLAVVIIGGGTLQPIRQIRTRFPRFHHTLGRCYILAAIVSSVGGIYMVWTRGTVGDQMQHIAITLDGILIIAFALIAVRYAIARNIRKHREWALRLFMVAAGVWFFRVGLMAWVMLTGGLGVDFESFTGPFLSFWTFGQYLLPLAILEAYLRARDSAGPGVRILVAATIMTATLVMGVGIFAATMGMWLPRMV